MSIAKQGAMRSRKRNEMAANIVTFIIVAILAMVVLFPI